MEVLLKNLMQRPQVFTLSDGSTLRLAPKNMQGEEKTLEDKLLTPHIEKGIKDSYLSKSVVKKKRITKKVKED